jgi:hypothetical protein
MKRSAWCEDAGENAVTHKTSSLSLKAKGFKSEHRNTGAFWKDIRLEIDGGDNEPDW